MLFISSSWFSFSSCRLHLQFGFNCFYFTPASIFTLFTFFPAYIGLTVVSLIPPLTFELRTISRSLNIVALAFNFGFDLFVFISITLALAFMCSGWTFSIPPQICSAAWMWRLSLCWKDPPFNFNL